MASSLEVLLLTSLDVKLAFLQTQIHDLKQAQSQNTVNLHSMALDPAVNLVFQKMKSELNSTKEQLEQAQSDLSAWKFTPDRYSLFVASCIHPRSSMAFSLTVHRIASVNSGVDWFNKCSVSVYSFDM